MSNFLKLFILLMIHISSLSGHPDVVTSTTTPTTTASTSAVKVNSVSGFTVTSSRDGLTKRGAQVTDLTESTATGKSYDPPLEFYRGPGSSSSSSYNNREQQQPAIASKSIAFPHNNVRQTYGQDDRNYVSANYNDWRQQAGVSHAEAGRHPGQDRISVGHYANTGHGVAAGGSYSNDYAYEARPYATEGVAGGGHATDYNLQAAQYAGSAQGGVGVGSTGGGGGDGVGGAGTLYYSSAEAIPFDLYSHNGNRGQYAGAGGEYSFSQYPASEPYDHAVQKGYHQNYSHKALLAKSFLIPLASAAVLGIAAALVSNPLLLQLGTVSGVAQALAGKRKRRALKASLTEEQQQKIQPAYRGHHAEDVLSGSSTQLKST